MKSALSYFRGSFIAWGLAVIAGYLIAGFTGAFIVAVLSLMETTVSFDNAVVNAAVLKNWNEKWRKVFLTWGILVAVFGMRLVFPVLIVSAMTWMDPITIATMAVQEPDKYATLFTSIHHEVMGFGGAFLLMVALSYFFDANKDEHWIPWIEHHLTKAGEINMFEMVVALGAIIGSSFLIQGPEQLAYMMAGMAGLIVYILAKGLGELVGGEGGVDGVIKASIGGFVYLEVLDASFSFDGVIAAFAMSNSLLIIALGLGVGAFFVRSMTIFLVDRGTLTQYRYLEHGAMWAILALAGIMFASAAVHVPEMVTGLIGAVLIMAAFGSSVLANSKDQKKEAAIGHAPDPSVYKDMP